MQPTLEVDKLVFLDEASINCAMTRLRGWGEKNARVVDYVSDARFERTSTLATVRLLGALGQYYLCQLSLALMFSR